MSDYEAWAQTRLPLQEQGFNTIHRNTLYGNISKLFFFERKVVTVFKTKKKKTTMANKAKTSHLYLCYINVTLVFIKPIVPGMHICN